MTAKKNDKEEIILNASIKVFSKKGYDLATIDEIAKKAKVSKGIVFFYYKKKKIPSPMITRKDIAWLSTPP